MLTPDKITEIFCIIDDFCKEYATEISKSKFYQVTAKSTVIALVRCQIVKL
jgi:hypothetical protein